MRRGHDEALILGDLVLRRQRLHVGTRSEGSIGRLFRAGREVADPPVGAAVLVQGGERPAVRLVFRGWERLHLWSASGWVVDSA